MVPEVDLNAHTAKMNKNQLNIFFSTQFTDSEKNAYKVLITQALK